MNGSKNSLLSVYGVYHSYSVSILNISPGREIARQSKGFLGRWFTIEPLEVHVYIHQNFRQVVVHVIIIDNEIKWRVCSKSRYTAAYLCVLTPLNPTFI